MLSQSVVCVTYFVYDVLISLPLVLYIHFQGVHYIYVYQRNCNRKINVTLPRNEFQ